MSKDNPLDSLRYVASTIALVGISPNESDSNGENANIVDGLFAIARALDHVATAIEEHP